MDKDEAVIEMDILERPALVDDGDEDEGVPSDDAQAGEDDDEDDADTYVEGNAGLD